MYLVLFFLRGFYFCSARIRRLVARFSKCRMNPITHPAIAEIVAAIVHRTSSTRLVVVGIDGMGGAGKTHLAETLRNALSAQSIKSLIVSLDDFCLPRRHRYRKDEPDAIQVYKYNFDQQQFLNDVLVRCYGASDFRYRFTSLNVLTDLYEKEIDYDISSPGVVLVEGIHLFKKERASYFDMRMFLTIDYEVQLTRAFHRDPSRGNTRSDILYKYHERYRPSYEHYLAVDRPLDGVDWIVNNNDWRDPAILRSPRSKSEESRS
jgi:uridine kinase